MGYEILAVDLDGTLLNSKKQISEVTKQALVGLMKTEKKVVLASGRPTKGILPLIEELGLKQYDSYVISYNGACVTNCRTGEVIYQKTLPQEVIASAYDLTEQFDMDFITYNADSVFCHQEPNAYTQIEINAERMNLVVTENFVKEIDFPVHKCMFVGDPAIAVKMEAALKDRYRSQYSIYRSDPYFVEIMPPCTDKGKALQSLLDRTGFSKEQLICCGDSYNDISMLEFAGVGVAMRNAPEEVKEHADYVTASNDEDGVARVIEEFFKNGSLS